MAKRQGGGGANGGRLGPVLSLHGRLGRSRSGAACRRREEGEGKGGIRITRSLGIQKGGAA